MKRIEFIYLLTGFCTICSCTSKANSEIKEVITEVHNTVTEAIAEIVEKDIKPEDIRLDKELLYDKHTLEDTYPYKDTTRHFQWEKNKGTTGAVGEHPEKADTMVYLTEL